MKPAAAIFGFICLCSPGYWVYSLSAGKQNDIQYARTLENGQEFINSDVALFRARFCMVPVHPGTNQPVETLINSTGMVLEEGDPGPQYVCGLDGTTARQMNGKYAEYAAADINDVNRYHETLTARGLIKDEDVSGYKTDDSN